MKVDPKRIKQLYNKYGSIENAISTKKKEYETLDRKTEDKKKKLEKKKLEYKKLVTKTKEKNREIPPLNKELKKLQDEKAKLEDAKKKLKIQAQTLEDFENKLTEDIEELRQERKDIKYEIKSKKEKLKELSQLINNAETQLEPIENRIKILSPKKKRLKTAVDNLKSEKSKLEKTIEEERWAVDSCNAITTILAAQGPEELNAFKEWVEELVAYASSNPPSSQKDVEAYKRMIIDRLMGTLSVYRCRSCNIRFIIDQKISDDLRIECPICHLSSVYRDDLSEELFKPSKSEIKLEPENP